MPPARKRTPARRPATTPPTPADAVADEVAGESQAITVEWRGLEFKISPDVLRSDRLRFIIAGDATHAFVFEVLGGSESTQPTRFLSTLQPGETGALEEFGQLVINAAGWGNSTASR